MDLSTVQWSGEMTQYLNPVQRSRHHTVISHILGPDGKTALCVFHPREKAWPRVEPGDWEIGDAPTKLNFDGLICFRCLAKQWKQSQPEKPKPTRKQKSTARRDEKERQERARLDKWNRYALEFRNGGTE
jgi:hypothetical protein